MVQKTGVLTAEGDAVPEAALWRNGQVITLPPDPKSDPAGQALPHMAGRFLWGGPLFGHFGHFLMESTARLWALEAEGLPPDGLLFTPKRPNGLPELRPFQRALFDLFGVTVPIHVITTATRIERLAVPGQGFGLGAISAGTAEMRAFVRHRFARDTAADGPARLYVSRSGLGERTSMILGETMLEDHLRAEGYEVFHPQDHSLAVQVARFRAARQIILADGSAAHLFGLVARADQRVAYLLRRRWFAEAQIAQIAGFSGQAPVVVDAIRHMWVPRNLPGVRDLAFAELDIPRLQSILLAEGFVTDPTPWHRLGRKAIRAAFERMGLWGHLVRAKDGAGQ